MVKITPVDISKVYTEAAKVAKRPRVRIQRGATKITEEEIAANKGVRRTANQYIRKSTEEQIYSNYLQLATLNGKSRFRSKQTFGIVNTLNWYQTTQDKTTLLKEILSIGTEHGTPLKASEIKGYLSVTSGMTEKEQNNVLDFLRMSKEFVEEGVSEKELRKIYSYQGFRDQNFGLVADASEQTQDYVLHTLYDKEILKKYAEKNQKFYTTQMAQSSPTLSEALTNERNLPLVRAVAKADDIQSMFSLVRILGVNETVMHSANSLTDILKLTGNGNLVMDLSKAFYPAEIKQIAQALKTQANSGGLLKRQIEYVGNYDSNKYITKGKKGFLSTTRSEILDELGLSGKVKLISMSSEPSYNKYKH